MSLVPFLGKLTAFLTFFWGGGFFIFLKAGQLDTACYKKYSLFWYFLFYAVQIAFTISERAVARR